MTAPTTAASGRRGLVAAVAIGLSLAATKATGFGFDGNPWWRQAVLVVALGFVSYRCTRDRSARGLVRIGRYLELIGLRINDRDRTRRLDPRRQGQAVLVDVNVGILPSSLARWVTGLVAASLGALALVVTEGPERWVALIAAVLGGAGAVIVVHGSLTWIRRADDEDRITTGEVARDSVVPGLADWRTVAAGGAALAVLSGAWLFTRLQVEQADVAYGAAALGLGAILVGVEVRRHHRWRTGAIAVEPRRLVLWATLPLVLAGGGTAIALGVLDRPSELSGPELAELLVVTAFGEELLFRGMFLPTAYKLTGRVRGEIVVACSFGLWHVPDAVGDAGDASIAVVVAVVLGQVVATTLAGFGFSWLRHRTGSLAGPVGAHVAINLPGLALRAS